MSANQPHPQKNSDKNTGGAAEKNSQKMDSNGNETGNRSQGKGQASANQKAPGSQNVTQWKSGNNSGNVDRNLGKSGQKGQFSGKSGHFQSGKGKGNVTRANEFSSGTASAGPKGGRGNPTRPGAKGKGKGKNNSRVAEVTTSDEDYYAQLTSNQDQIHPEEYDEWFAEPYWGDQQQWIDTSGDVHEVRTFADQSGTDQNQDSGSY